MKKGNPIAGYALILLLVLLVGLVITTVARDIMGKNEPVQVAEPGDGDETQTQKPAAQQAKSRPQQGRIWEGTM
jgi:hypothetical protein